MTLHFIQKSSVTPVLKTSFVWKGWIFLMHDFFLEV